MSSQKFTNNASSTLGSAAGSGVTSMTVATGTGDEFPAISGDDFFVATLWAAGSTTGEPNEIVKVTARVGDTMTVVRGQEGTTAQAWGVGDTFALYPTAAFYNGIVQQGDIQLQSGNAAVDVGTANAGVITLDPAITNLNQVLYSPIRILKMASANTGAYTLNVNGLGVKQVKLGGSAVAAGQLPANIIYEVVWDGTQFDLLSAPALIPNNQLFNMPALTLKGNITGGAATPSDVPLSSLLIALGFGAFSFSTSGYYIMPSGFIIQWTSRNYSTNASISVSWPITFPTACLWCDPGWQQTGGDTNEKNVMLTNGVLTTTGYSASSTAASGSATCRLNLIALGH